MAYAMVVLLVVITLVLLIAGVYVGAGIMALLVIGIVGYLVANGPRHT